MTGPTSLQRWRWPIAALLLLSMLWGTGGWRARLGTGQPEVEAWFGPVREGGVTLEPAVAGLRLGALLPAAVGGTSTLPYLRLLSGLLVLFGFAAAFLAATRGPGLRRTFFGEPAAVAHAPLVLPFFALLGVQGFVVLLCSLALPMQGLGALLLWGAAALLSARDLPRAVAGVLLAGLAALCVPAYGLLALAAVAAFRLKSSPRVTVAALGALLGGPLLVALLWWDALSLLELLVVGGRVTASGGASLQVGSLASRLALSAEGVAGGLAFLLASWGQPVRLASSLLTAESGWFNPLSLLFGAGLLLTPPVCWLVAALRGRGEPLPRHRFLTLLLAAAAGFCAAFPEGTGAVSLSMALLPLFLLSLLADLASLPRRRWLGGRPLAVVVMLLLCAGAADLVATHRTLRRLPPSGDLGVQLRVVEEVLAAVPPAPSLPEGAGCTVLVSSERAGMLEMLSGGRVRGRYCAPFDHPAWAADPNLHRCPEPLFAPECPAVALAVDLTTCGDGCGCDSLQELPALQALVGQLGPVTHGAVLGRDGLAGFCLWQVVPERPGE